MKPLKIMAVLLAVALAGCAGAPTPVIQRVEVPVPVPCVAAGVVPAKPIYQFGQLPQSSSDGDKVLALLRDWVQGRKYEDELEAVLSGCR